MSEISLEGKRLLIAGGGTGGHLFPALAVGERWEQAGGEVLYMGSTRGLESRLLPQLGHAVVLLNPGQIKGRSLVNRLQTLITLPRTLWQAWRALGRFRPHVVLGVGGYASVPGVVAAWLRRIPAMIHEQNARPGLANRWLGKLVQEVFLSFPEAARSFPNSSTLLTGNPVRGDFVPAGPPLPGAADTLRLLVFGGSQGAQILSEVVPAALQTLVAEGKQFRVCQQARQEDLEPLKRHYQEAGIMAEVVPFIDDMAAAYRDADLVISRAGASTVAELTVMGRPALLVPYPYAADDHQVINAEAFARGGGGWFRRQENLTVAWLSDFLRARFLDREGLVATGNKAASLAHPEAAGRIVNRLADVALDNVHV